MLSWLLHDAADDDINLNPKRFDKLFNKDMEQIKWITGNESCSRFNYDGASKFFTEKPTNAAIYRAEEPFTSRRTRCNANLQGSDGSKSDWRLWTDPNRRYAWNMYK